MGLGMHFSYSASSRQETQGFIPVPHTKLGVGVQPCPWIWEMEAERTEIRGCLWLPRMFKGQPGIHEKLSQKGVFKRWEDGKFEDFCLMPNKISASLVPVEGWVRLYCRAGSPWIRASYIWVLLIQECQVVMLSQSAAFPVLLCRLNNCAWCLGLWSIPGK